MERFIEFSKEWWIILVTLVALVIFIIAFLICNEDYNAKTEDSYNIRAEIQKL